MESKVEWEKESFIDAKRDNLIVISLFILYLFAAGITQVVWSAYSYGIGIPYCMSINIIFLILFASLTIYYIKKKMDRSLVMGMLIINFTIIIAFILMILRSLSLYYDNYTYSELVNILMYGLFGGLFMGFVFLIHSLLESGEK